MHVVIDSFTGKRSVDNRDDSDIYNVVFCTSIGFCSSDLF